MNRLTVRPLCAEDYARWLPLWDANNQGQSDDTVTFVTWQRLTDPDDKQVNGLCAEMNGELMGIVHYILHPTTGAINPVCYMQDVFVSPDHRRKGIGKRLVLEVTKIGQQEKWARMYWITQANNTEARAMYQNFGIALNFTFYVLPLNPL